MEGCACASPTDREPADTDHRAPAPREGKPLNLDMPRPARFLALEGVTRVARGPIAGERGASFSYDSIQSYLCIWRS
jgi:hypothetical protein